MARYDYALVDLDGVVWLGSRVIEENVRGLKALADAGVKLVYLTNNSTRTRLYYAWRLSRIGLPADPQTVVTSAVAAAEWLARRLGRGGRVYPLGEEGLAVEHALRGLTVVSLDAARRGEAEAVVVGLDRTLSYPKLAAALRAVQAGALFVAANRDNVIPVESGFDPGAGSIVAALEAAAGRPPDFVAGKPNPWIVEVARAQAGIPRGARVLVIGDRVDMDVELARRAGLDSLLVLTGVAGARGERSGATYVTRNVEEALPVILED